MKLRPLDSPPPPRNGSTDLLEAIGKGLEHAAPQRVLIGHSNQDLPLGGNLRVGTARLVPLGLRSMLMQDLRISKFQGRGLYSR